MFVIWFQYFLEPLKLELPILNIRFLVVLKWYSSLELVSPHESCAFFVVDLFHVHMIYCALSCTQLYKDNYDNHMNHM